MVSPQQEEILWVLDFVGKHERDAFDGLFSSVDIVSQKQVILVPRISTVLEQLYEVWELTVDVALYYSIALPQIFIGA